MKQFHKFIFLMAVVFCGLISTGFASDSEDEHDITWNGMKRPAMRYINRARSYPLTDPFAPTEVFKRKDRSFINIGTVTTVSEEDLAPIKIGDFVYTSFYRFEKTPKGYTEVGAFILETKDQKLILKLRSDYLKYLRELHTLTKLFYQAPSKSNL